jgi:gliding motility-associated protein GldL
MMLNLGMGTEVLLFLIGVMDKPHASFHWEEVFPQLVDPHTVTDEEKEKLLTIPRPDLASVTGGTAPAPAAKAGSAASRADVPALKDEDLKALKDGIADLAKTASQFSELGKVATSGVKLGEKLAAAEAATDSYAAATTTLAQNYTKVNGEVEQVITKTKAYGDNVEQAAKNAAQVGKSVAALNSVYELQLQTLNSQVEIAKSQIEAAKAQTEAQKNITAATKQAAENQIAFAKEAAEAQAAFAKGAQQLQKQVTDLNAVYGNMLNALS